MRQCTENVSSSSFDPVEFAATLRQLTADVAELKHARCNFKLHFPFNRTTGHVPPPPLYNSGSAQMHVALPVHVHVLRKATRPLLTASNVSDLVFRRHSDTITLTMSRLQPVSALQDLSTPPDHLSGLYSTSPSYSYIEIERNTSGLTLPLIFFCIRHLKFVAVLSFTTRFGICNLLLTSPHRKNFWGPVKPRR